MAARCLVCNYHLETMQDGKQYCLICIIKEAHDKMDEANNMVSVAIDWQEPRCMYCGRHSGYDGDGILHEDNCILLRMRRIT